jgi:hypothetical protein
VIRLESEPPLGHETRVFVVTADRNVEPFASLAADAGDLALDVRNLEVVEPDIPVSFRAVREELGVDLELASEPGLDQLTDLITRGIPLIGVPKLLGFSSALVQITVGNSCRACDHDHHFPERCRKGDDCPLHL